MVLVQIWSFFQPFFLGNIGQKNDFYDILERKNAFLRYKNKKFRMSKNLSYSKGVNPQFWCKYGHSSNLFFLGNIGQENDFYDILERRNAFLGYKKCKKYEMSKNLRFCKGVNPSFWSKTGRFSNFFILNIGLENDFYDIIERKNAFLGYKNLKFKKSKN